MRQVVLHSTCDVGNIILKLHRETSFILSSTISSTHNDVFVCAQFGEIIIFIIKIKLLSHRLEIMMEKTKGFAI